MCWIELDPAGIAELERVTGVLFVRVDLLVTARDRVVAAAFHSIVGGSLRGSAAQVRPWPEYTHDPDRQCEGVRMLRPAADGQQTLAIDLSCSQPALVGDLVAALLRT